MRFVAAAAFLAAMSCSAHASSFVVIEDEAPAATPSIEFVEDTPSIQVVGDAPVVSSSIIALGPPPEMEVEVARQEEAPVSEEKTSSFGSLPYVIRAGIEGDAFVRAISGAAKSDFDFNKAEKKKKAVPSPLPPLAGASGKESEEKPKTDPLDARTKLR